MASQPAIRKLVRNLIRQAGPLHKDLTYDVVVRRRFSNKFSKSVVKDDIRNEMGPDRKIDHKNPDIIIFAEGVGDFAGMSLIHNPRGAYRRYAGFSLMKGLPGSKLPKEERALIQMVDQKAREAKEAGSEGPSGGERENLLRPTSLRPALTATRAPQNGAADTVRTAKITENGAERTNLQMRKTMLGRSTELRTKRGTARTARAAARA
eukprot:983532_1